MPSIVVGVTAYVLIVQRTKQFSGFAGSIALVVLMVPIITRTTEEILRLVPSRPRERLPSRWARRNGDDTDVVFRLR